MKKYLLLYVSLFFCMSPLSGAMDYDQDEGEYDENGGENTTMPMQGNMQNNMMQQQSGMMFPNNMMQQSGMMPQNNQNNMMMNSNMRMNQGGAQIPYQMPMQNNMQQQPGMMPRNNMMMNQNMMNPMRNFGNGEAQDDETDKKEYVQSLVNSILKVNRGRQSKAFQNRTANGGTVVDRNLKNKLFKLQKDLDEISRSLAGISQDDESSTKDGSSKKSKSSAKSSTKKKSSEKSGEAKEKKSSGKSGVSKRSKSSKKAKSSKSGVSSRGKSWSRKRKFRRVKKFSKFSRPRSFYTVKQLTPENAVKYVPKFYSSTYATYNRGGNSRRVVPTAVPAKEITYKIKNWGTGEITSANDYYLKNSQSSYFSDKSKCNTGCGAR